MIERGVITAQGGLLSERDVAIPRQVPDMAAAAGAEPRPGLDGTEAGAARDWVPGRTLDDIERGVIIEALAYHQGNRTHTARALGISIRTLRNKLADYRMMGIRV